MTPSHTDIFGARFDCDCGRNHVIEPREVLYADDAVPRLPEALARHFDSRDLAVVMDARTRDAAGAEIGRTLAANGWRLREIVVPDPAPDHWPVCDEATKEWVGERIADAGAILSVGSGVVSDLGKWTAFDADLPFACFATAASMNGYASANIALTKNGVKTMAHARPPRLVASSGEVLRRAPYEMTAAGLGDVLAKSVSSTDWRLNQFLFGDYYCAPSVELIEEIEPLYLDHPRHVREGRPEALEALFRALILTGVSMTMAGSSAPASGGEHLVSHTLDMIAAERGKRHDFHGRQVGVGTILASALYERVLAIESPEFIDLSPEIDRTYWGALASPVFERHEAKQEALRRARETLSVGSGWDDLRMALSPMVRPATATRRCLQEAEAAWRASDLGIDIADLRSALLHAHEMREKFTILDLARLTGVMPSAVDDIMSEF